MNPADALLRWVSENGSGSWSALKAAAGWLYGPRLPPWVPATRMSALGHLEIDWDRGRWAAARPVVATIPYAGLRAILVGRRLPGLLRDVREERHHADLDVVTDWIPQAEGPELVTFTTSSASVFPLLAQRLGVHFEVYPALRIASAMGNLNSAGMRPAPPPVGEVEEWNPVYYQWQPATASNHPGLYKAEVFGRPRHVISDDGRAFFHTELDEGRYRELRRRHMRVVSYAKGSPTGSLLIPAGAPLPALQARALTLLTGLLPRAERASLRYENVPSWIARLVATSLGQELKTEEPWAPRIRRASQ